MPDISESTTTAIQYLTITELGMNTHDAFDGDLIKLMLLSRYRTSGMAAPEEMEATFGDKVRLICVPFIVNNPFLDGKAIISVSSIATIDPTLYGTRILLKEVDVHGVNVIYNSTMNYEEFKKQILVLQHTSDLN